MRKPWKGKKAAKANSPRRSHVTRGPTMGPSGGGSTMGRCSSDEADFTSSLLLADYDLSPLRIIRIKDQWGTLQSHCVYSVVSARLCGIAVLYRTKPVWLGDTSTSTTPEIYMHRGARYMHTIANCLERTMSGQCTALSLSCARLPQTNCAMDPANRNDARPLCSNP